MFNKDISEKDILNMISNLKDDTFAGYDKVNVKSLKSICTIIIQPLMYIYNSSIKCCIFPEKFKKAIVIPLFKNGTRFGANNYRPISMLCNFSKILEKIIKSHLITYLETNKLYRYLVL